MNVRFIARNATKQMEAQDEEADRIPLSCSPFQAAGANILLLAVERFKSTAVRQGKRHDHENERRGGHRPQLIQS